MYTYVLFILLPTLSFYSRRTSLTVYAFARLAKTAKLGSGVGGSTVAALTNLGMAQAQAQAQAQVHTGTCTGTGTPLYSPKVACKGNRDLKERRPTPGGGGGAVYRQSLSFSYIICIIR